MGAGERIDRGRQGVQPIVELAPLNECDVASDATKPERKQKQPLDYKDVAMRRNRLDGDDYANQFLPRWRIRT